MSRSPWRGVVRGIYDVVIRSTVTRVPAELARQQAAKGEALLVCAYEEILACNDILVRGAISLTELKLRLDRLSPEQQIIFYCASEGQDTAIRRAMEFRERGFARASALEGGSDAWTALEG
jgi:rhodanese-related sulfurtransferase